jgi:hypothetical protein
MLKSSKKLNYKEQTFVKESKESIGIFFFDTETSNSIDYLTDMCWSCSCTTVVNNLENQAKFGMDRETYSSKLKSFYICAWITMITPRFLALF